MTASLAAFRRWLVSPIGVAVNALGISQIVGWGTTFYVPAVLAGPMIEDTGWRADIVFGGLTAGLLVSGLVSTLAARFIDRFGARLMMTGGSLLMALGLAGVAAAPSEAVYLAAWAFAGIGMRLTLYDAAFAAVVQISARKGRRAISYLTLWGALSASIFWPICHLIEAEAGWRVTMLVFAALNALLCAPLHWFGLARPDLEQDPPPGGGAAAVKGVTKGGTKEPPPEAPLVGRDRVIAMVLFAIATSSYAFIFGAASAHFVGLVAASGVSAGMAVTIASLKGVTQIGARLWEVLFAGSMPALAVARVPVWLMAGGFAVAVAIGEGLWPALAFTACFGAASGLITIVRGAVPLALFGAADFGRMLGILATPFLLINAAAPVIFALVIEAGGYMLGYWVLFGFAVSALVVMEVLSAWGKAAFRRSAAAAAASEESESAESGTSPGAA